MAGVLPTDELIVVDEDVAGANVCKPAEWIEAGIPPANECR